MSDEDRSSRTEEATETKIRDALAKGNVPVSREVPILAGLLGMLVVALLLLPRASAALTTGLGILIDRAGVLRLSNTSDANGLFLSVSIATAVFLLPPLAIFAGCGILSSIVQTPVASLQAASGLSSRVFSPAQGLQRLLGIRGVLEFTKSLAKVAGLGVVTALVLRADAVRLVELMHADPAALPAQALVMAGHLLVVVSIAMGLIVALDVIWTRRRWREDLRMTRHEVKEEHKQSEGDPLVKSRLRSIALDRARRRMMKNVRAQPSSSPIPRISPWRFATCVRKAARRWSSQKGQDLLALHIREIARENAIPIIENKPLARALYDQVPVDRMIPAEFYRAVAEILNMLGRRKGVAVA